VEDGQDRFDRPVIEVAPGLGHLDDGFDLKRTATGNAEVMPPVSSLAA
jgi:hypothetical protein